MYETRSNMFMIAAAAALFFGQGGGAIAAEPASAPALSWPYVSETVSPIEELTVVSPTGYHSPVTIRRPPGPGPFPLVVVLHGGTVPFPVPRLRALATTQHNAVRLLAAGYAIAAPTFSSRKEDPQTTAALRDCLAVIDRVRRLPGMDSDSVFVFGGSGGGSLALELAGETKLAGVAAGEPADVLFTGVWGKDTIGELQAIMDDPLKYCDNEKTRAFTRAKIDKIACPILIVHSDVHPINKINDLFVIPMMKEAGKAPEICYVPGVKHGFYFALAEHPEATLKAFEAIEPFFRRLTHTPPTPIDPAKLEPRPTSEGMIKGDDTAQTRRAGPARAAASTGAASRGAADIDWDKVRALRKRVLAGETLAPEEQAYYEKGVAAYKKGAPARANRK
ncbi:MAG: prolyl oligopeptidase family serine peptidase [Candidatus Sumerlaeota bacterium]|nr:prolyl oligopeptidase family serine peptidase [Candidatus Sumerlaeota bacterium]